MTWMKEVIAEVSKSLAELGSISSVSSSVVTKSHVSRTS
jgi:hypothetical protein